MAGNFASIDVQTFDAVVSDFESTLDGLTKHVAALRPDFEYFGVELSNLNLLRTTQFVLEDIVPELRERHRLADQLLAEGEYHPDATVVTFEGDLLNDDELVHRADISESIGHLKDAGLLDGEPGPLYREWISWTLKEGLDPEDIVQRARQEDVTTDTFALLRDVTIWRTPDGQPYARIEDSGSARDIVRLIELLNGGEPSKTDWRRDANSWSYSGYGDGDVGLVLTNGGAVAATPEGIMMAAPGPKDLGIIPNFVELFTFKGGTTWGEMYIINGSHDDPEHLLYNQTISQGKPHPNSSPPSLDRHLRHERVHSEQWARLGQTRFIVEYLWHTNDGPCHNPFEIEAGLEDAGYECN